MKWKITALETVVAPISDAGQGEILEGVMETLHSGSRGLKERLEKV